MSQFLVVALLPGLCWGCDRIELTRVPVGLFPRCLFTHVLPPSLPFSLTVPVEPKKVHIEVKETRQSQKTAAPEAQNGSEEDEDEEDDDEDEEDEEESDGAEEEEKKKPVTQSAKKVEKEPSSNSSSESDSDDGLSKEERLYEKAKRRIEVSHVPTHTKYITISTEVSTDLIAHSF